MGKIPKKLKQIIAQNIRDCRIKKFPGRGGGKKCAEAFGVSPQQWSPWERGMRTPDEERLDKIAEFFGVTVDFMRKDHTKENIAPAPPVATEPPLHPGPLPTDTHHRHSQCPFYRPPQPGQPMSGEVGSMCWLAERLFRDFREHGLRIRIHPDDMALLLGHNTAISVHTEAQ